MSRPWGRNRLGVLAAALAAISVDSYVGVVIWSNYVSLHPQASAGKLGSLGSLMGFAVAPVAAAASAITGIAAVAPDLGRACRWALGASRRPDLLPGPGATLDGPEWPNRSETRTSACLG
jgi:hypothetical protein